jgi:enoyl-CoA hydratase/carnithine racemase
MSDEVVTRSVDGGVAVLTLNRPDRLNAWTAEMKRRYFDLLEECAADGEIRAIVLTGAGRGFCAGADMDELRSIGDGGIEARAALEDPRPHIFPLSIPKPLIAAINGPCAGLGLVHALMCDLRFAAAGAKITTAFSRRGLVAEHGISWILPRVVGPSVALDLLFSSRIVLAEEAKELGLVNRVIDPARVLAEAVEYARELAINCAPSSMATMKRQIYADLDRGLPEALDRANELMVASFARPDFTEGVASFVERRAPRFAPLAG